MKIPLNKIDLDASIDARDERSEQHIEDYTEHLQTSGSVPLPAIMVFGPDSRGQFFLSEGWHRYEAHKRAGRSTIEAIVTPGGWIDAQDYATSKLRSNARHGWRETRKQKRRAVMLTIMRHAEWTDVKVADHCGVSRELVIDVRSSMCRNLQNPTDDTDVVQHQDTPRTVTRKNGKPYTVPTRPQPSKPPVSKPPSAPPSKPPEIVPEVACLDPQGRGQPDPEDVQPLDTSPEPDELPKDERGKTVLPHLLHLWEGRSTLKGLIKTVREVRKTVEQAIEDRDPLFCGSGQGVSPISCQALIAALKRSEEELKAGIPYSVCGSCNGTGCRGCSGNGLVTELQLSRLAPEYRS